MSEMSTSKVSARVQEEKAPEHKHPQGVCDVVVGHDDQGRRVIQQALERKATYRSDCRACQLEDKKRMDSPSRLTAAEMETTLFLIPEPDYDNLVARQYLKRRHQNAKNIVAAFHAEKLSFVKDAQIVVISRRGKDGNPPQTAWKRQKDAEDVWQETKLPPETFIDECVESEPIMVSECLDVVPATMFSEQSV